MTVAASIVNAGRSDAICSSADSSLLPASSAPRKASTRTTA